MRDHFDLNCLMNAQNLCGDQRRNYSFCINGFSNTLVYIYMMLIA